MARYAYQGQFVDQAGNAVNSGTISVYLAGTTTAASVYTASSGGTAVNSVTSDSVGKFLFYVDTGDYNVDQKFKIVLSKSGFLSKTYDEIIIFPPMSYNSTGIFGAHGVTQSSTRNSTTGTVTGFTQSASSSAKFVSSSSTFTGNYGTTTYTIGDIVRTLKKHGFMTT